MKWIIGLLMLALIVPSVLADDGAAKAEFDKVKAELTAAQGAYSAAMKVVTEGDEYKLAIKEWRAVDRDDKDAQKTARAKVTKLRSAVQRVDTKPFIARFQKGAEKFKKTPGAIPFLVWLTSRGGSDAGPAAFEAIASDHADSDAIGDFIDTMNRATRLGVKVDTIRAMAAKIIEVNPNAELKAGAYYARAQTYLGGGRPRKPKAGFEQTYKKDLAAAVKIAPDSIYAMRIQAPEFLKTRLQIGMVAPDIAGEDIDGSAFKLSEYRGKVVVIDFWGDW